MITLLILIADMWYYMFTGNSFLYYGTNGIMAFVYIFVGVLFTIAECSTFMTISENTIVRKLNKLKSQNPRINNSKTKKM